MTKAMMFAVMSAAVAGCVTRDDLLRRCDGQDADWVRLSYGEERAREINAAGYTNWVNAAIGYDLDNGYYKMVCCVPEDVGGRTRIQIGDFVVYAVRPDDYVFLLEKGLKYGIRIDPPSDKLIFKITDDLSIEPYNPGDKAASEAARAKQMEIRERITKKKCPCGCTFPEVFAKKDPVGHSIVKGDEFFPPSMSPWAANVSRTPEGIYAKAIYIAKGIVFKAKAPADDARRLLERVASEGFGPAEFACSLVDSGADDATLVRYFGTSGFAKRETAPEVVASRFARAAELGVAGAREYIKK